MDKNEIVLRESENDGQSVFLYYDELIGLYMAFGQSVYYVTMVTDPFVSYSVQLDIPVGLLRREHILALRQSMEKVEHIQKRFYWFRLKAPVGKNGYTKWVEKIHKKHEGI